jgi:hypothetical protein
MKQLRFKYSVMRVIHRVPNKFTTDPPAAIFCRCRERVVSLSWTSRKLVGNPVDYPHYC